MTETGDILEVAVFVYLALVGYNRTEIEEMVTQVLDHEGTKLSHREVFGVDFPKSLKVRNESKELMDLHKERESGIWVVTASSQIVVQSMLRRFFNAYNCRRIGITSEEDHGVLTGHLVLPIPSLQGKVDSIKKYIHPIQRLLSTTGDSPNDEPMLRYSILKVVAGRNGRLLEKVEGEMMGIGFSYK